jgi:hypothetical protein
MKKSETLRRRRLGDVQRLLRSRYRYSLPDDDAGREDLRELLLLASLAYNPERSMGNTIQHWAPWMDKTEAEQLMDDVNRTPDYLRKPSARVLGERLRLTSKERTELGIVTIRPFDMTDEQLLEQRKAKDAERKWRKRRATKMKPREAYLANCKSRTKPWEKRGETRRTWYRNEAKRMAQVVGTGVSAVKITNGEDRLVPLRSVESQQEGLSRKQVAGGRKQSKQRKQRKQGRKAA